MFERYEDELLTRLLEKYLNPLKSLHADEYIELARLLLDFYRVREGKFSEYLRDLLDLSARTITEDILSEIKKEGIKKALRAIRIDLETLLKLQRRGLQILGLETSAFALSAKGIISFELATVFVSILKLLFIITPKIPEYFAKRSIRKLTVEIEALSKRAEEVLSLKLENIIRESCTRVLEKVYKSRVHGNTPEVLALAQELQKIRNEVFYKELS